MCGVRMCGMEAQLNVRVHGVRVYGGVRMWWCEDVWYGGPTEC